MNNMHRQKITEGIHFYQYFAPQFKTNRISICFSVKLSEENASAYALLPDLLKNCCGQYKNAAALNRALAELYGAVLVTDVRKMGDNQVLIFTMDFLDNRFALQGESIAEEAISILLNVLLHPNMTDGNEFSEKLFIEKQHLTEKIKGEINDKRTYAIHQAERCMFGDSPYGISVYGTETTAENLTPAFIKQMYEVLLRTANIQIIWTGSKPIGIFEKLDASFSEIKREKAVSLYTPAYLFGEKENEFTEHMSVKQAKLVLGFSADRLNFDKDIAVVQLLTALYGGTAVSKLFLQVREKLSLCYYCAARYDYLRNIMMVDSGVEAENIARAKEEILRQFEEIVQGNITEEEIKYAKLSLTNSLKGVVNSHVGIESWYFMQIFLNTKQTPEERIAQIENITLEDIRRQAGNMRLQTTYILTKREEEKIEETND